MKISKFESFDWRFPKEVDLDEWSRKKNSYDTGDHEKFTEVEKQYLQKLIAENSGWIYEHHFYDSNFYLSLYQVNSDDLQKVIIYKMQDEWFLIYQSLKSGFYDTSNTILIADQFDEVKGYFARYTCLR
jgi:hypothetical protein